MTLVYTTKLGLTTQKTSVGAQKIDNLPLKAYSILPASFLLKDSLEKDRFFEKIFLLANTSIEMVLEMSFLAFINADFQFGTEKLTWRFYTTTETLSTSRRVKSID